MSCCSGTNSNLIQLPAEERDFKVINNNNNNNTGMIVLAAIVKKQVNPAAFGQLIILGATKDDFCLQVVEAKIGWM